MNLLIPDWPAPDRVRSASSTRRGGVSQPPFDSFNLALHVNDQPTDVVDNRRRLVEKLALPGEPYWLNQVHGTTVANLDDVSGELPDADASTTITVNTVCVTLTADCLPVLFCDRAGTRVAAAHAGWRGLAAGILEATVAAFTAPPEEILAWLGPAIGPQAFEVGDEVRQVFCDVNPAATAAFVASRPGHWLADLYPLARQRLARVGVNNVYGGGRCTFTEADNFYSFRRDGSTGRMASFIWLEENKFPSQNINGMGAGPV